MRMLHSYLARPFGTEDAASADFSPRDAGPGPLEGPLGAALTGIAAVPLLYSPPVTIWLPADLTIQTIPGRCHSLTIFYGFDCLMSSLCNVYLSSRRTHVFCGVPRRRIRARCGERCIGCY